MKKEILYLIFVSIIAVIAFRDDGETDIVELNASVKYADKKFIITNKDTVDFIPGKLSKNLK